MYAWPSEPIAAGFIVQSGTVLSLGSQAHPSKSADAWYTVVEALSCGNADSDPIEVLRCMKTKDWAIVQDAIPRGKGLSAVVGKFGPTVDEQVVFSDYVARSVDGRVAKRPLLIGNTHNEAGLFKPSFARQNVTFPEARWDELSHTLFTCSTAARALASVVLGMPTWRYRWFGDYPSLLITESPPSGAWHGSEVPIIFDTSRDVQTLVKRTTLEEEMTVYTRGAWAAFAKDPVHGLTRYVYSTGGLADN